MGKRTCVGCAVLVLVAAALSIPSNSAAQADSQRSERIKTLMTERRDVLAKRLEIFQAREMIGLADVIEAREDLISAELELATTRARRIELLKSRIELRKQIEEEILSLRRVGGSGGSEANLLLATSRRLLAEIELERALNTD